MANARELREILPESADEILRGAAEDIGVPGELRRITLSDGGVLVDADDEHSDDEIRAALEDQ